MIVDSLKEYCSKIATQSNESHLWHNDVNPGFGPTSSMRYARGDQSVEAQLHCENSVIGTRIITDLPTHPTSLVVVFCTIISIPGMRAVLRAHSARSLSREGPPAPKQEVSSNPILILNDR